MAGDCYQLRQTARYFLAGGYERLPRVSAGLSRHLQPLEFTTSGRSVGAKAGRNCYVHLTLNGLNSRRPKVYIRPTQPVVLLLSKNV